MIRSNFNGCSGSADLSKTRKSRATIKVAWIWRNKGSKTSEEGFGRNQSNSLCNYSTHSFSERVLTPSSHLTTSFAGNQILSLSSRIFSRSPLTIPSISTHPIVLSNSFLSTISLSDFSDKFYENEHGIFWRNSSPSLSRSEISKSQN